MTIQLVRRDPNGRADGNSPAAGEVGEYLSASMGAVATDTTTANTDIDVTQLSLPVSAGLWLIGYHSHANVNNTSGSPATIYGRLRITTAANVAVANTESMFGSTLVPATSGTTNFSVSRQTVISINTPTTYKVRVACNVSNTTGFVEVDGTSLTGGFTDPDNSSTLWALRIG